MQIAAQDLRHHLSGCHAFEQNGAGIVLAQRSGRHLSYLLAHFLGGLRQFRFREHFGNVVGVEKRRIAHDHAVGGLGGSPDLDRADVLGFTDLRPFRVHETMQTVDRENSTRDVRSVGKSLNRAEILRVRSVHALSSNASGL